MNAAFFSKVASFLRTESSLDALRNILTILLPSSLLFLFWDGHIAVAFAVGTLLASLTDLPGNKSDKLSTAFYCIPIFFVTAITSSLALHYNSWIIVLLLGFFGFVYTIIALLGFRINVVGNLGLIVASFTIGLRPEDPIQFSLSVTAGAIFFFIVCIAQVYLFPHRSLRYAVEGGISNMAKLIRLKVDCYDEDVPLNKTYKQLSALHSRVSDQLESVRSILLRDKRLLAEGNAYSKRWLAKLYQLVDLYELLMAVDNDYETIRETLSGGNTLHSIRRSLAILAFETSRLMQSNKEKTFRSIGTAELNRLYAQLEAEQRQASPEKAALINSISAQLKQLSDILQHIHISKFAADDSWIESKNFKDFVAPQSSFQTIIKNLNFRSPIFSYAVRMSILLISGGLIGYLLPEYRYASWILLTIILVARPSYTITQKRNYERIVGSLIGIAISLLLLLLIKNTFALLAIAALCLYLFLLFNKPNYLVCVIFITITILLGQKLHEGELHDILGSRFAFTLLGSIFAVLGCLAIPINHYRSVEQTTASLFKHFRDYLEKIQESYQTANLNHYDLRLLRKFTQASLAQSYDSLEQFGKEPLRGKAFKDDIQHLQTLAYRINALLVGLSVNITKLGLNWNPDAMNSRVNYVQVLIEEAEELSKKLAQSKRAKDNSKVNLQPSK